MKEMDKWGRFIPRLLAVILGVVFLGAGILKSTDLHLFMMQMKAYGVISHPVQLLVSSWGMIVLQCTLGMALLIYYRPKWTLTLTVLLWLVLLGGTVWAWVTGSTDECGCYGSWLKNTPRQATLENAIFLLLAVAARLKAPVRSVEKERLKQAALSTTLIVSLVLPVFFGVSVSEIIRPEYGMNRIDLGQVKPKGSEAMDFSSGTHLVLLMGTDCPHCLELMPEVETLAVTPGLPKVIAFCLDSESRRLRFIEEYEPSFPIRQIDDDLFWRLLGNGSVPRLLLVRQGRIVRVWDQIIPDPEMILDN